MPELFKGWVGTLVLLVIAASLCDFCLHSPPKTVPNANAKLDVPRAAKGPWLEPRPTHPLGHEIHGAGNASKDILIGFSIDEHGLTTDEQVEAQTRHFSMSEVGGWTQGCGWSITLPLSRSEVLKAMGTDESQLQHSLVSASNSWRGESRRISASHRMLFEFWCDIPSRTRISFPRDSNRPSGKAAIVQSEHRTH